jgi:predicted nuclease of predicted toxin-antitoxin system
VRLSFLFDECLTPRLSAVANERGFEGAHVNERELRQTRDSLIARYCIDHDLIMVTNNARDYRRIYAHLDLHPGPVIILPSVRGPKQEELFLRALNHLTEQPDLVNKLLEVDAVGQVTVSDLPEPDR